MQVKRMGAFSACSDLDQGQDRVPRHAPPPPHTFVKSVQAVGGDWRIQEDSKNTPLLWIETTSNLPLCTLKAKLTEGFLARPPMVVPEQWQAKVGILIGMLLDAVVSRMG